MKRKSIATILVFAIVVSLFSMMGSIASAANYTYTSTWAVENAAGVKNKTINDSASNLRPILGNSLGAPDAMEYYDVNGTADNAKITSIRYYDYVQYGFGGDIVNHPDEADLTLSEVTVGKWHPEAVEIILVNAYVDFGDGYVLVPEYPIGIAFNHVGNMLISIGQIDASAAVIADGFSQEAVISGNYTLTNVYFPENVDSAAAVKLIDRTRDFNIDSDGNPIVYHRADGRDDFVVDGVGYKANFAERLDGFDLDAIGAWLREEEIIRQSEISAFKFNDKNHNGLWDFDEVAMAGVTFLLMAFDGTDYVEVAAEVSDDSGLVSFGDWDVGQYKIVEVVPAGYTQTSYLDGCLVEVTAQGITVYDNESGMAPEFGNYKPYQYVTCGETAMAGWVTNETKGDRYFPKGNKNPGFVLDGVVRTGGSAWEMAVIFDGTEKTVDLVMGQNKVVGTVTLSLTADNKLNVTINVDESKGILRVAQIGAYSKIANIPAPGQNPVNVSGINSFTYTVDLSRVDQTKKTAGSVYVPGTTVYVMVHTEVSAVIAG